MSNQSFNNKRDMILQVLFLINAAFWLVTSVFTFIRLGADNAFTWMMTLVMIINGLIFMYFGLTIQNSRNFQSILAICFLVINIFLTLTDQFGLLEMVTLIVNMVLFLMIIMQWFRPKSTLTNE